jgi:predicted  nucleic acid-binding Zn-ribbon protein
MAVVAQLFRLEELDAEIERRERELVELRRRQRRNPELEAAEQQLDRTQTQERDAAAEQRRLESDLADLEGKIERDHTRMYGGQIVDPRELSSLERELQHHREQRDGLEERILTVMEQREELERDLERLSRRTNELRQRWEEDGPALARQEEDAADALAGLRDERERLAAAVEPRSLSLYGRLRTSSGHAVSHVTNGICQWCRVTIPAKDVQHARAGSLVTCPNCARILHVGS